VCSKLSGLNSVGIEEQYDSKGYMFN